MDQSQLVQEKLKLDKELQTYIKQNGFDYAEFCAPPHGSWYEDYRQRASALEDQLLPKLHDWTASGPH